MVKIFLIPRNAVDVDGDGNITIDEFVEKGLQSKFINDLLLTTKVGQEQEQEQACRSSD